MKDFVQHALGTLGLSLVVFAGLGCGEADPLVEYEAAEPGLSANPKWLTFTCTQPGCASTKSSTVSVIGTRDIAIRRIVLSEDPHPEFTLELERTPPFVLKAGEPLPVVVEHVPTGDPNVSDPDIRVAFTDASAREEEGERVEAGELLIPLVRRLVGEAQLAVSPAQLSFGSVFPSAEKTLQLDLSNTGFGNVGLVLSDVTAEPAAEVRIGALPASVPSGGSHVLDVTWAPTAERFLRGTVTLTPVGRTVVPTVIPLLGTSIRNASLDLEPASGIDFGNVDVGQTSTAMLQITNRGGQDLVLSSVRLTGVPSAATMSIEWPPGSVTSTLASLRSTTALIHLEATAAARLDAKIEIQSNDLAQPTVELPVTGLLAKPQLAVDPVSVSFGTVPQGWAQVTPVTLSNAGYGELVINNVSMVLGSSQLFSLKTVPTFPARLKHDERLALEVEFRAEAAASFSATMAVESNDPDSPFTEVPLTGVGATCMEGCPIQNGTPDCSAGMCAVGSCNSGWYDTDADPATGCECQEPSARGDPGTFCAEGIYLGSIDDDGDSVSFTGVIHDANDVDMIRIHAHDSSQVFGDDYDVRITLSSSDPGIEMCVYRRDTENHVNECILENVRCGRSFRRDGSYGSEDGADYTLEVKRNMSTTPSCTSYSIFARNG